MCRYAIPGISSGRLFNPDMNLRKNFFLNVAVSKYPCNGTAIVQMLQAHLGNFDGSPTKSITEFGTFLRYVGEQRATVDNVHEKTFPTRFESEGGSRIPGRSVTPSYADIQGVTGCARRRAFAYLRAAV